MYRTPEEVELTVTRPDDPTAPLAEVGPVEGRILRQRSGVAWFVDAGGVRHWIPDGDTFFCLGGTDALVGVDLPAYAIWTLPEGDHATCES